MSWSPRPEEQEIVYRLLQELGDRRLLWVDHQLPEQGGRRVEQSVAVMREAVTKTLGKLSPESKGREALETIRRALHDFHNLLERRLEENPDCLYDHSSAGYRDLYLGVQGMQERIQQESATLATAYEIPRSAEESERLNRRPWSQDVQKELPLRKKEVEELEALMQGTGLVADRLLDHGGPLSDEERERFRTILGELREGTGRFLRRGELANRMRGLDHEIAWFFKHKTGERVFGSADEDTQARRELNESFKTFVAECERLIRLGAR